MQRFGAGDVFRQPARRVLWGATLLNVCQAFEEYEHAPDRQKWRASHAQQTELIEQVKAIIDDDDQ